MVLRKSLKEMEKRDRKTFDPRPLQRVVGMDEDNRVWILYLQGDPQSDVRIHEVVVVDPNDQGEWVEEFVRVCWWW